MKVMHKLFLSALLLGTTNAQCMQRYTTVETIYSTYNKPEKDFKRQFSAFLKGSAVGCLSGIACHLLERPIIMPASWMISFFGREVAVRFMINHMKKKTKDKSIETILSMSAWEASWISYFLCKQG